MAQDIGNEKARHLVRAGDHSALPELCIRHPLNPNAEVHYLALSDVVGMKRAQLALGRIPPGKESFIFHFHRIQEEFLYILSGEGTAEIGDRQHAIGPGDYMDFPTDGVGHHLINSGSVDLVYLMGGERSDTEVAHFPKIGKRLIGEKGRISLIDDSDVETFDPSDWVDRNDD